MEAKKQSGLAKKYWKGESTLAEEKALLKSSLKGVSSDEKEHFEQLKKFSTLSLETDFELGIMDKIGEEKQAIRRSLIPYIVWKIAAVVVFGLSTYFLYQPIVTEVDAPQLVAFEKEDPEKAFEMTKQALLLISTKLNKASKVDLPLNKFEETRKKIQEKKNS